MKFLITIAISFYLIVPNTKGQCFEEIDGRNICEYYLHLNLKGVGEYAMDTVGSEMIYNVVNEKQPIYTNCKLDNIKGMLYTYYPSGNKCSEFYFDNGFATKKKVFTNDGNLFAEYIEKYQEWKCYSKHIKSKDSLTNEININLLKEDNKLKKNDTWNYYYDDGHLFGTGICNNDFHIGEWKYYWKNSKMSAQGFYDYKGRKDSLWVLYDSLGNKCKTISYKEGKPLGKEVVFYLNGKIRCIGDWGISTKIDSLFLFSFDITNGEYLTSVDLKNRHTKRGSWKFYDYNGDLLKEEFYNESGEISNCTIFK